MPLSIKDLEAVNPHYNPVVSSSKAGGVLFALETYSDFYRGGRHFEKNKDKYLRRRPIENEAGADGYRQNRLAASYYTPHAGGIGDNLCGTALQYPPKICVKAEKGEDKDTRAEYWENLNSSIDGKGTDTRAFAWSLLSNLIMHKRAYIVVDFPPDAENANDATFCALGAKDVDDWQYDEDGNLEWVRTHVVDLVRSSGKFGPVDTERHTWTFFTADATEEYQAERKIGTPNWPDDMPMLEGKTQTHGLGVVPIFPIEVEDHFWVMDRLYSTANAYFNRESTRSYTLDTGALTLPVVKTNKDVNKLVVASGFCIKLEAEPASDFKFASPDAGIYEATQSDCEYLLSNLYSALNQMALTAAAKDGNPRQSGTAKSADSQAIKAFLSLLCNPVMAAIKNAVKAVQAYRDEEDLELYVIGMDKFDVQNIELEINRCLTYNTIANMPQTWRKASMKQATRAYLPNLSEDEWDEGEKELDDADMEAQPAPAEGAPKVANATTGRPAGFSPDQQDQQFRKMNPGPNAGKKKETASIGA